MIADDPFTIWFVGSRCHLMLCQVNLSSPKFAAPKLNNNGASQAKAMLFLTVLNDLKV